MKLPFYEKNADFRVTLDKFLMSVIISYFFDEITVYLRRMIMDLKISILENIHIQAISRENRKFCLH